MKEPLSPNNESYAVLKWEFEGLSKEQVARFKETIDTIITQGVLNIHDGKAILSFDYEGTLREIRYEFNKWKKKKVDNSFTP